MFCAAALQIFLDIDFSFFYFAFQFYTFPGSRLIFYSKDVCSPTVQLSAQYVIEHF